MFHFATDAAQEIEVVSTIDPAVQGSDDDKARYLRTRDESLLQTEGATRFVVRALTPPQREAAEVAAGVYKRSELGRQLWLGQPDDPTERARWQHKLPEDEREALASYQAYLSRVFVEMVRVALVEIDDQPASDMIDRIKPEAHRLQVISELVQHIQRISLLGISGK